MASILLDRASVEIPIYNSRNRSLKSTLLRQVGGTVQTDERDVVTIKALQNVTLELRPGDRLGLIGHNGAGKSTLMRVLSGAYEPTSGRARITGSVASLLDITMGMDGELTGADNIILRSLFNGMSIEEARSHIPDIAAFSELGAYLHLPMRTYSSGMTLRLAFAISTTRAPDILLMDELISVGDANFSNKAKARIEGLIGHSHIMVLASHDPVTLRRYCNKAIVLESGIVVAQGSMDEAFAFYNRQGGRRRDGSLQ